jgi:hypothetical protein
MYNVHKVSNALTHYHHEIWNFILQFCENVCWLLKKGSLNEMDMVWVKFRAPGIRISTWISTKFSSIWEITHPYTHIHKLDEKKWWDRSFITQFRVTIATNYWALTCCMNVNAVVSNKRGSSFLFQYIVSNLWVLIIILCEYVTCNIIRMEAGLWGSIPGNDVQVFYYRDCSGIITRS